MSEEIQVTIRAKGYKTENPPVEDQEPEETTQEEAEEDNDGDE
jgi:hypothetical protein